MPMYTTPPWDAVWSEFDVDGSWRDIYVLDTTKDDWTKLLGALHAGSYPAVYTRSGAPTELPRDAWHAFPAPGQCDRLLTISVGRIVVLTHFFDESQIEMDIDPREVGGQEDLDELLQFLGWLSDLLGRDAILTPENAPHYVIFRARPGRSDVAYVAGLSRSH